MSVDRREFLAGAVAAGLLPGAFCAEAKDWRAAFASCGFDPSAPGCGVFAVVGDPHVTESDNAPLKAAIGLWNGMSPRPALAISVGDQLCRVSSCFGDRKGPQQTGWEARSRAEAKIFADILTRSEIPFKHVIGNHDTYPDEPDGRFYASCFPGWRPYERLDVLGIQFLFLNGGHDGWIDPAQEAWMAEQRRTLDPRKALVLVAHQPSMSTGRENGIPRTIRRVFSDWTGEFWFLGGHEHLNALARYHLPNGNMLGVATHARAPQGFWLYGVRGGRIACRLFVAADGLKSGAFGPSSGTFAGWKEPSVGKMPGELTDRGLLPVPFEGVDGVLWTLLVGEDDDKARYRVEFMPQTDAGHWYFYIGRTTYRLPLGEKAPSATRVGILGALVGNRKTKEPERIFLSSDGETWTACARPKPEKGLYVLDIPPALRGKDWLYVRVDGFGYGADSSIAGYALLA